MPLRELDQAWFRGHKLRRGPLHFNRASGRFAPPDRAAFGMLYLGADPFCSFIEMFALGIQAAGEGYVITEDLLRQSCICEVRATRPLRVVDLTTGPALVRLAPRADNRISDGSYAVSQCWAEAIWAHPDQPDGILYRCRRAPERFSLALFDRVEPILVAPCHQNLLQDAGVLGDLLDEFACALIP